MWKVKERILKDKRKRDTVYKGIFIKVLANFSAKSVQDRKDWLNTLKVLKGKKLTAKNTQQDYHFKLKEK